MAGIGNSMNRFRVRPAEPRDCPEILRLIKELAAYENMPEAVKITETDLLRDGFGSHPFFQCLVAEVSTENVMLDAGIVGFAMYYYTYDPWIGKLLYLEDFYVMDEYRAFSLGVEGQDLCYHIFFTLVENNRSDHSALYNQPSITLQEDTVGEMAAFGYSHGCITDRTKVLWESAPK